MSTSSDSSSIRGRKMDTNARMSSDSSISSSLDDKKPVKPNLKSSSDSSISTSSVNNSHPY